MRTLRFLRLAALLLGGMLCASAASAQAVQTAGDIDIFLGTSGGNGDAPNVMILIDNSPNWSRAAQQWPDAPTQGQAEVAAIYNVLGVLQGNILKDPGLDINVGLAMLSSNTGGSGTGGGYIRFGARSMASAINVAALQNILKQVIYNDINGPLEKLAGQSSKDETAGLYEVYKYFSGLAPYTGQLGANPLADAAGNTGGGPTGTLGLTAFAQGLTSGWAIGANGLYQSPITSSNPCSKNYIIYIANNANGSASTGPFENVYESTVVPALTALAAAPAGGGDTWTDEWTNFFYKTGARVPAGNNNGSITTFILDAYNKQNNASYSASLRAAGNRGIGGYQQVSSLSQIQIDLLKIFEQIQSVNATFASASLPVNATNRAQDQNQVFVPLFRPDATLQPRWFGNLKQYHLINFNGAIVLGDGESTPQPAINPLTGFPTACAQSVWTSPSADPVNYPGGYWSFGQEGNYAKGTCPPVTTYPPYDDSPDGPIVEKGGVAEVIRKGNSPPAAPQLYLSPTWSPAQRNVLTTNSSDPMKPGVVSFPPAGSTLPLTLVSWIQGWDVQDENGNGRTTGTLGETRPSVHGDEVHSRPLPIDYGSGTTRVFYGSNDGTLRAVDGGTGKEIWAFVPPEFYTPAPSVYPGATPTGLERLMWSGMKDATGAQISPIVNYFSTPAGVTPTPTFKDYYFDGSIGVYEGPLNSSGSPYPVYIYPAMRRGGRMLYGLDVSSAASASPNPVVLWRFGCPHLGDDLNCASELGSGDPDVSKIGETWSTPAVTASVVGYTGPVVIVGAGYDSCEDYNIGNPSTTANTNTGATGNYCPTPQKGAGVFVLDAVTGQKIKFFATNGSVAGDVALISVANAGVVDHAYAADTQGNVYRIDFGLGANQSNWVINLVAYTHGAKRKFLFAPALLAAPNNFVYVALGSGDREHPLSAEYPYLTPVVNRFYVFKDDLTRPAQASTPCTSTSCALNLDGGTMENLTFGGHDAGPTGQTSGTICSTPGVLPVPVSTNNPLYGWYIDLNQNGTGEQTVTSALIVAGMVAFSTNVPVLPSAGSCSTLLGMAFGYWLNLFNASGAINSSTSPTGGLACGGLRDSPFVGGGLPPSPVMAAVPVDGQVVQAVIGAAQLNGGTNCGICPQQVNPAIVPVRKPLFWKGSGEN